MAQALHAAGVQVVAVSRTQSNLDRLVREVQASPCASPAGSGRGRGWAARAGSRLRRTLSNPSQGAQTPWAPKWSREWRRSLDSEGSRNGGLAGPGPDKGREEVDCREASGPEALSCPMVQRPR